MRGVRSLKLLPLAAAVVAASLALAASPALAARGHEFDPSLTLGTPCTEVICGPGELSEPAGVAVNEATDQVYVLDQGNSRIEIFNGATGIVEGEIKEFEVGGVSRGFEFGAEAETAGIAIDNSCALHNPPLSGADCTTFDPSAGDVYVVEAAGGRRVVDKFSAAGAFLGEIGEAGGTPFQGEGLDGVGVGTDGSLYIYRENPVIDVFSGAAPSQFIEAITFAGFGKPGFAVDREDDFYLRHNIGLDVRAAKLDHSGQVLVEEIGPPESSAVAADQVANTAYVDNLTSVGVFSPGGEEVQRLGEEGGAHHLSEGAGIGVDAATGFLYVADSAAGQVVVFGPQQPGAPSVEPGSTSVSSVASESATLNAEVNPRSEEDEGVTTYFFELGSCDTPTSCSTSPYTLKSSSGSLPPDFEAHSISTLVSGLQPATTYHYRAAAENSHDPGAPSLGEERTFTTQPAAAFTLPDSRQWELVSPAQKLGARIEPIAESGLIQAAADGSALTYLTSTPTSPTPAGYSNLEQVLSSRGGSGWSTRDIGLPHVSTTGLAVGPGPEYKFFDPNLTLAAVQPFGEFIPQLSPEASEQTAYLRDLSGACGGSCYRPLVTGAPGFENVPAGTHFGQEEECRSRSQQRSIVSCGPSFLGASEDLTHVVLRSAAPLTAGAGERQLYEWSAGALTQISVAPLSGGSTLQPSLGLEDTIATGAISADGTYVFWQAEESEGGQRLYVTDSTTGKSVALDEAETGCVPCEAGAGEFQFASADGSRAFFTDSHALTASSGGAPVSPPRLDLYECRISLQAGAPVCALTDLTPKQGAEAARVEPRILGSARDGSVVYFVAEGILAGNSTDHGPGPESAQSGQPNLYVLRDGTIHFIATLSSLDDHDYDVKFLSSQPTRVSPNGEWLELMSQRALTGYDNRDASGGEPVAEVYLYGAAADRLICASCDPSGARPHGVPYRPLQAGSGGIVGGVGAWSGPPEKLVAAVVPGWTAIGNGGQTRSRYQDRYLSDSGRLFFNANDALAPGDSNGTFDVYEYEPAAVGGCSAGLPTFSARSGGCVDLISAGTSGEESAFLDASESGDDVFFLTASRLAGEDTDNALDVYDAHVCSAASPCLAEPAAAPGPCKGEACRPAPPPPGEPQASSQSFFGEGNLKAACPKGKVRKAGRCVKKHTKKKHRKHKGKRHAKKSRASSKHGGRK